MTYRPQATTTSRIATIRKAAMPARKRPAEATILFVVAAASAGTMRFWMAPNWANGASKAMNSRLNAAARATLRWEWSAAGRVAPVIDRFIISFPLVETGPGGTSALVSHRDRRLANGNGQRSQHSGARGVCSGDPDRACPDRGDVGWVSDRSRVCLSRDVERSPSRLRSAPSIPVIDPGRSDRDRSATPGPRPACRPSAGGGRGLRRGLESREHRSLPDRTGDQWSAARGHRDQHHAVAVALRAGHLL